MHIEGSYRLDAPVKKVWEFVSNPEKIGNCLPDLEHLEVNDPENFNVTVKAGISFVRGSFKFAFRLLDQTPPSHSRLEAIGKGAGVSVRLNTSMQLVELSTNATQLNWQADADFGGLLKELSPSLIQSSTDKFTKEFFDCLKRKVES
jgi:hypothetical protein